MKVLVALSMFLCSAVAFGSTLNAPELSGKVFNHSKYELQDYKISIQYSCRYWVGLVISQPKPCGQTAVQGTIGETTPDGGTLIHFPAAKLHADKPLLKEAYFSASIEITPPEQAIEKTDIFDRNDDIQLNQGFDKLQKSINAISLYQYAPKKVRFVLADGTDAIPYLKSIYGTKDSLRILLDSEIMRNIKFDIVMGLSEPIAVGAQAFGTPIENFYYPGQIKVHYGNDLPEFSFKLVVRMEPDNWRDYHWGNSWKIVYQAEKTLTAAEFQGYPDEFIDIPVNETWIKQ